MLVENAKHTRLSGIRGVDKKMCTGAIRLMLCNVELSHFAHFLHFYFTHESQLSASLCEYKYNFRLYNFSGFVYRSHQEQSQKPILKITQQSHFLSKLIY